MFKHLSYDGHGINDVDKYRTRLATFTEHGRQAGDDLGYLLAAAPDLLAALRSLVQRADTSVLADGSSLDTLQARAAIAQAEGRSYPVVGGE